MILEHREEVCLVASFCLSLSKVLNILGATFVKMCSTSEASRKAIETVDNENSQLNVLSQEIWKHPELNFEEIFAHQLLTAVLEQFGFVVQKNYILQTAFRAEYQRRAGGPTIAVICEYDALPEIGHACGHNLIAEAGIAAGFAIKSALDADPSIAGKVVVLGTPAEEGGGGKIKLIEAGAFNDIDVAMMVHPSPTDYVYPAFIALSKLKVKYWGKAAHASGYPWEGLNALDAAVACYSNIALLRQQIKPTCRVHGIITKGGTMPSIIPEETELEFYVRAGTSGDLANLKQRVELCCLAAAQATGCKVKCEFETSLQYDTLITNSIIAELYRKHAQALGVKFLDENCRKFPFTASTDMGNVSHVVPSIHPTYSIGTSAPNHSTAFTEASGAETAQHTTLIAGKAMALAALDIMCDPQLVIKIKELFKQDLIEDQKNV